MTSPPAALDDVVLHSERLVLRALRAEDDRAITEAMQNHSMHEFLPLPDPYTLDDARAYIRDVALANRQVGRALECGLEERATGRLVGTASLFLPAGRSHAGEIGYAVYPAGRGKGYATEATRALASWGYTLSLPRIELRIAVANVASLRVALASGFRYEGVERAAITTPAGTADAAVFGRLPGDPDQPIAPALPPLPASGLSDRTVTLRPVTPDDGDLLVAEAFDRESQRWSLYAPDERRARASATRAGLDWLVGPHFRMVITESATGTAAGTISLYAAGPPGTAIVGYGMLPAFRRRGWTVRALRLLTEWCFSCAALAHLTVGTDVANLASQKVALAAGFRQVATMPSYLRRPNGSYADERTFALTASAAQGTSRISP